MFNRFRNQGPAATSPRADSRREKDGAGKLDKPTDHGRAEGTSWVYIATILLLSGLLWYTTTLLREDNRQLEAAVKMVKELDATASELREEMLTAYLHTDDNDLLRPKELDEIGPECEKELAALRTQASANKQRVMDLSTKVSAMQESLSEFATIQNDNSKLEAEINRLHKEKRTLAKRLGIKMAGEGAASTAQ